jgi:hypothetical protein
MSYSGKPDKTYLDSIPRDRLVKLVVQLSREVLRAEAHYPSLTYKKEFKLAVSEACEVLNG